MEEQGVAEMGDGEGGFDACWGGVQSTWELERSVEKEGADGWIGRGVSAPGIDEGADAGCGGEVEGEEEDVALTEGGVDGLGGECLVGAGGDDDEVVGVLASEKESGLVSESGGATGDEDGVCVGHGGKSSRCVVVECGRWCREQCQEMDLWWAIGMIYIRGAVLVRKGLYILLWAHSHGHGTALLLFVSYTDM